MWLHLNAKISCSFTVDKFFFDENIGCGMCRVYKWNSDSQIFFDFVVSDVFDDWDESVIDYATREPDSVVYSPIAVYGDDT
jgi:hypothetical protein